jgi:hypothetical protein
MLLAIRLHLDGIPPNAYAVVSVEAASGQWVEVIRERADGCYSHIVEPSGIQASIAAARPISELIAASSIGAGLADIKDRGIDAHLADVEKGRF